MYIYNEINFKEWKFDFIIIYMFVCVFWVFIWFGDFWVFGFLMFGGLGGFWSLVINLLKFFEMRLFILNIIFFLKVE